MTRWIVLLLGLVLSWTSEAEQLWIRDVGCCRAFTPMDAIRAATLNSALLLAQEKDLGSIAAGKFADLIAVAGYPLADIDKLRQVRGVVKAGRHIRPD